MPTGITVVDPTSPHFGRDLRDEIMTGWLDDDVFISDMTIGSFVDIGFVAAPSAVPEPATWVLLTCAAGGVLLRRRAAAS